MPAGQGRILQLPAEGQMAIGFLTVFRPAYEGMEFSWRADQDGATLCPYEDKLIIWWDGPEISGEEIGIDSGRLVRGLNILDISVDNENQETYSLLDAKSPITVPSCLGESSGALRSCGIPGDRGVSTLLPGFDDYPTEAPAVEFSCFGCGSFYEIPNQCSRVLDVLCRECYSTTVHVYPDEVPSFWPCVEPKGACESGVDEYCGLGRKYACRDEGWVLVAQCEDTCCEDNCVATTLSQTMAMTMMEETSDASERAEQSDAPAQKDDE